MRNPTLGVRRFLTSAMLAGVLVVASGLSGHAAKGDPGQHVAEGLTHWENARLEDAKASFQAALKADPQYLDAHLKLGGLYLRLKEYQPAIDHFQSAIGLDPENSKLFTVLGMLYMHSGKLPLAQAALGEALRISPDLKQARDLQRIVQARIDAAAMPQDSNHGHTQADGADKPAAAPDSAPKSDGGAK